MAILLTVMQGNILEIWRMRVQLLPGLIFRWVRYKSENTAWNRGYVLPQIKATLQICEAKLSKLELLGKHIRESSGI